ncbi:MAG TPA: ABC transporter permease [Thermoanaerobaculia bacterium]|nr:ABC transporter permease [Thermoanaerobaculia bacterium]
MIARIARPAWSHWLRASAIAIGGAALALSVLLLMVGRSPAATLAAVFLNGFGSQLAWVETVTRAVPLLLCALATAIPARAGLFNIGVEGQFIAGAIGATSVVVLGPNLPAGLMLPAVTAAAMAGGALWGWLPGLLRGLLGVSEVLSGLMLNYVAIFLMEHLVHGPWKDPHALGWPYSIAFPNAAVLPRLGQTNIHLGLLFGLALTLAAYVALRSTTWGFSVRLTAANPRLARRAGVRVGLLIALTMALGGAAAALAGLGEVSVIQGRLRPGLSSGLGYAGFLVSFAVANRFEFLVPATLLVAGLYTGADALQLTAGLPSATVDIFMGVLFVATFIAQEAGKRRGDG